MRKFIFLGFAFLAIFGLAYLAKAPQIADASDTVIVGVHKLNVRKDPSTTKPIIAQVAKGQAFAILNERFGWLKIAIGSSQTGWIAGQYTFKKEENPSKKRPAKKKNAPEKKTDSNEKQIVTHDKKAFVANWIATPRHLFKSRKTALQGKTIVIDPGHGGKDSGAITESGKTMEKTLTLQTAQWLAKKLRKAGATVILTRKDDHFISLSKRVQITSSHHADAFISIHYNASLSPKASGITSFYYARRKDRPLAAAIQKALAEQMTLENRGVHFANDHVLRENPQPAILLELGFLTNPRDVRIIQTANFQNNVASAITDGIENDFSQQK